LFVASQEFFPLIIIRLQIIICNLFTGSWSNHKNTVWETNSPAVRLQLPHLLQNSRNFIAVCTRVRYRL